MMGTSEEAEVRKEARVVGEVALTKETKERQQTVKDTVRRTDVEVEEIEPPRASASKPSCRASVRSASTSCGEARRPRCRASSFRRE